MQSEDPKHDHAHPWILLYYRRTFLFIINRRTSKYIRLLLPVRHLWYNEMLSTLV